MKLFKSKVYCMLKSKYSMIIPSLLQCNVRSDLLRILKATSSVPCAELHAAMFSTIMPQPSRVHSTDGIRRESLIWYHQSPVIGLVSTAGLGYPSTSV